MAKYKPSSSGSGEAKAPTLQKEASKDQYFKGPDSKTNLNQVHLLGEKHLPWLNGFLGDLHQHHLDSGVEPNGVIASWLRLKDDLNDKKFHQNSSANVAALLSLQIAVSGTRTPGYVEELTGLSKKQLDTLLTHSLVNQPLKTSRSLRIEKDPQKLAKDIKEQLNQDQLILRAALIPDHLLNPLQKHDLDRAITGKSTGLLLKSATKQAEALGARNIEIKDQAGNVTDTISIAQFDLDDPTEFRRFIGKAEAARSLSIIQSQSETLKDQASFADLPDYLTSSLDSDNITRIFTDCLKEHKAPAANWDKDNVVKNSLKFIDPEQPKDLNNQLNLLTIYALNNSKLKEKYTDYLKTKLNLTPSSTDTQSLHELTSALDDAQKKDFITALVPHLVTTIQNEAYDYRAEVALDFLDFQLSQHKDKEPETSLPKAKKIFESLKSDALEDASAEELVKFIAAGIPIDRLKNKSAKTTPTEAARDFFVLDLEEDPPTLLLNDQGLPSLKAGHKPSELKKKRKQAQKLSDDDKKKAEDNLFNESYKDEDFLDEYYKAAEMIADQNDDVNIDSLMMIQKNFKGDITNIISPKQHNSHHEEILDKIRENPGPLTSQLEEQYQKVADQNLTEFNNQNMEQSKLDRLEDIDLAILVHQKQIDKTTLPTDKQDQVNTHIDTTNDQLDPDTIKQRFINNPEAYSGLDLASLLMILGDTFASTLTQDQQNKLQSILT